MITLTVTPEQLTMLTYAMQRSLCAIPDLKAATQLRDALEFASSIQAEFVEIERQNHDLRPAK